MPAGSRGAFLRRTAENYRELQRTTENCGEVRRSAEKCRELRKICEKIYRKNLFPGLFIFKSVVYNSNGIYRYLFG